MSEGHRVLRNLYPTASANSRTCNTEIPPTAKAPLKHPDLQWLVDDTGKINKFSHACHRASLLMRAKSPKERVLNTYLSSGLIPNGPAAQFWGSNVQTHTLNTTATLFCFFFKFQILEVACEIFILFHNLSQFWKWKLNSSDLELTRTQWSAESD